MKAKSLLRALALTLLALPALAVPSWAGDDWQPIDPAQLKMTESTVEPGADAEAIFWDVHVEDQMSGDEPETILNHYLRVKIFTDHGKETESQIDIPYFGKTRISNIAGRTIKPDGTIILLKSDAVFDRTIVKLGGRKLNAKSFAMPAVEPGCIIEYRWRETRGAELADHVRLQFQRDIPVERVTYHIKPLDLPGFTFGMKSRTFHLDNTPFVQEPGGFAVTSAMKVPAFREEPHMPAEDIVRPWMLVYYSEDRKDEPAQYWQNEGKELYGRFKGLMKVNDDIKKAAVQIIGDASTPDGKLTRLYEFCRTQIKNVSDDASGLTQEQRDALKDNKNPWDTLAHKQGSDEDIDLLFASLANAAGFDAHLALTADHDDMAFDPSVADRYFLRMICVAVKVGDGWRFCDPSEMYLPYGMLNRRAEGQQALITDPKTPLFVETPVTDETESVESRTAKLTLSEDGTLEGDVRIEYTGHLGAAKKEYNDDDSAEQREETLRDAVKKYASTAEVTDIKIENVTDPIKPFTYTYHVRIPGYAQRTGKRLFVQPSFFQYNTPAMFTATDRRYTISFDFPWTETDDVVINLPKGYALDNADAPASFSAGKIGGYDVKITATADSSLLHLKRKFFFGGGGALYFQPSSYAQIRNVFDTIHTGDTHAITIKQQAATAAAGGN